MSQTSFTAEKVLQQSRRPNLEEYIMIGKIIFLTDPLSRYRTCGLSSLPSPFRGCPRRAALSVASDPIDFSPWGNLLRMVQCKKNR